MKPLCLALQTPQGEEIGRLPLSAAAVTQAGESDGSVRPRLGEEMQALQEQILQQLSAEGMELCLDPIDFGIRVSEALLSECLEDADSVLIPLPVREVNAPPAPKDGQPGEPPSDESFLDGLFELNDLLEDPDA